MRTRFALLSALALAACGGGGGDSGPPVLGLGTLNLWLADAPACGMDKVFVTVEKVRVHTSSTAGDADTGWVDITPPAPVRVDLLTLTNGTLAALGQATLPAGSYQQLRLVLAESTGANPMANAVRPSGATADVALETPSGLQSGLKINAGITVTATQRVDWAIDFDACKSIVQAGHSGRYQLKPVLQALPLLSETGQRVVGYLDAALANGAATVSVQQAGKPVRTTPTDATGKFVLYPVPAGEYDLVLSATGRATAVMTGVPVAATSVTTVGSDTLRLVPPTSASAEVSGTVSKGGSVANTGGAVRALLTFNGGPNVEAGYGAADATTGRYRLTLPTGTPVRTTYLANATAFTWTPRPSEAGKFRLEASVLGVTTPQTADINLTGYLTKDWTF
ncbi:DUF4382 domain-containing protein [Inhella gelatinilytica]|uniref:DUF4382 domain-containing protein n=1 Tax=Inhella gelatinilytica TaxID=2795030 RepID=A0A931ISP8_9BURK|nr:DUF4382 domain-containing protein [Inhella gelatinilytica]MBH9551995.1 DUF4382 domain-containing protein [Inhella gelatinilytica]